MSDHMDALSIAGRAQLEARMRLLRLERERNARLAIYAAAWDELWSRPSKGGVVHTVTPFPRAA